MQSIRCCKLNFVSFAPVFKKAFNSSILFKTMSQDIFNVIRELDTPVGKVTYYSLKELQKQGFQISKMPFSIRVLVENALRNHDGLRVTEDNVRTVLSWNAQRSQR
jgi:aconitate hydratase